MWAVTFIRPISKIGTKSILIQGSLEKWTDHTIKLEDPRSNL